jgi:hypothetical protein
MGGKVALQFAESCTRGDYGHSVSFPKHVFFFIGRFINIFLSNWRGLLSLVEIEVGVLSFL